MKKIILAVMTIFLSSAIFAASYTNNTYQKLADEYNKKAQLAFDAGEYDLAIEYSQKAAENAELSKAYIDMMLARRDADSQMKLAQNKIKWAESIHAERNFPMAFTAAKESYANAESAYTKEDFELFSKGLDILYSYMNILNENDI